MPRGPATMKSVRASKTSQPPAESENMLWRLDRLERQVQKLSELVRDHAEDADRLVRIVAEDRDILRRELLHQYQAKLRIRKRVDADSEY